MNTPDPAEALRYGLAVFALPPGGRLPEPGWQGRCLSDPAVVSACWRPGDNIGVGCRASGVVVLDVDAEDGGAERLEAVRAGRSWPRTLAVATPGGGRHLYFRAPSGVVVPSSSGSRSPLGLGVDIRAPGRYSGGYVLGPGSLVPAGRYTVAVDAAVAALPGWLAELVEGAT